MTLLWILILPLLGGLLAWLSGGTGKHLPRWISLLTLTIVSVLTLQIWYHYYNEIELFTGQAWLIEFERAWIPQLGISFYLALDGLSLLLIALTAFLGMVSVIISWNEIQDRVGFFHFNLLWILAGIIGVFIALDLFLFFFFWEMMLIPMYFLIVIWGHEDKRYAAIKFFIFTQASGLMMLVAILALYFVHGNATGMYTFNYNDLLGTDISAPAAMWLMLGFFIAFGVKLPAVPVHTWLPDAHTQAPTAGSVILAGLLLKTGAYGLLRFTVPLFPEAATRFAFAAMLLGVLSILYGAKLAFAQTDFKRLVAYTSVSHMGFVLLGIFAWNELALHGAVVVMLAHGFSTGALFILAGLIQNRIHTRDMDRMGGMWTNVPRMGAAALFFSMASLGLPGLGNFIGEFLVLVGLFQINILLTVIAAIGIVAATIYSIWIIQRIFHGEPREKWEMPDLNLREMVVMLSMMLILLWLGLYPRPVLNTAKPALDLLQRGVTEVSIADEQKSEKEL
jgi:NADH-quinone oxidoreductase subunit M